MSVPPEPPAEPESTEIESTEIDETRRRLSTWLWRLPVMLAAGAGSWAAYEALRVHFFKRRPDPTPTFVPGPTVAVAPVSRFDRDWTSVEFLYDSTPAVATRLPGPIPGGLDVGREHADAAGSDAAGSDAAGSDTVHLAAFSRICTHLGCIVALNRDAAAIAFAFNYRADGPQLVCPCHLSVFDPARSGRAVSGPAIEPLPRVRLELRGSEVVATGIEPAPEFSGLGG